MNACRDKWAWRSPAACLTALWALAVTISAYGEVNVERLDGAQVTRLVVNAGDGSVTTGTVATEPLGLAVVYDAEPTGYISGCWSQSCTFGFADELRFWNFPPGGGELSSYSFSYAAGYGWMFDYCNPNDPRCDCYCPTGAMGCGEGDPPYTVDAGLYDGPPGLCGGGLPITGTEVEIVTSASRPLGDRRIDVRVELEPKVFVPPVVWGVVTFDIEDAWLAIGSEPAIGSSTLDGAMWIDSDSDGCWDEWDCWPDPYGWTCPGCTGWSVWDAEANAEVVMRWQPVPPPASTKHSATSTYTIQGNEAIFQKGGEPVWMEIRVSDFDPKQTGVLVKAWQAGVDPSGYTSGLQGTLAGYLVPCTSPYGVPDAQCESQIGPDSWCNHPGGPYPDFCTPGWFRDADRTDYIFHDQMATGGQTYLEPNYRWGSTLMNDPIPSPGRESYLATMVVFVPPDAKGTFEIGFLPHPDSALVDGDNQFVPLLGFVPGKITVEVGACCIGLGVGDKKQGCIEEVTANQCENIGLCKGYCQDDPVARCMSDLECELQGVSGFCIGGETLGQICSPLPKPLGKEIDCDTQAGETCMVQGVSVFKPGSVCTGDPCSDCGTCLDDLDCDDGNPCTQDICDVEVTCTCSHAPDYDADTQCCDPDTGKIQPLDDGDPCTLPGACDPTTGEVTRPPAPAGIPCGEGDTCVFGYYCDGAGSCVPDPAPVGTACDDGDECTTGDQCDGAGECVGEPVPGRLCTGDVQCSPGVCRDGVCQCPWSHVPVPAISRWGVIVIVLLVAALGKIYFGRRRGTKY